MEGCIFCDFKILDMSGTSLKLLSINTIVFPIMVGGIGLKKCEIKVACPSLVSLDFIGPFAWDFFQELNSLQNVFIYLETMPQKTPVVQCQHVTHKILEGLHNIKVLKLAGEFLEACVHISHCVFKS
ncbi:hypothetical protein Patl1_02509 [Pistacia atlantica]|uniref:Uncharacterized protein n=1 Tax=Pistacia atlantica TaxID=434234 RepID=A0ACC1C9S9_9ROSI|nr:hypothetical protein Patl1_02509 [Pistacia atlantica]